MSTENPIAEPVDCVVVLVHGTLAPGAPWTQEGSKFRRIISEQLKGKSVRFERFDWYGSLPGPLKRLNNSHTARLNASAGLRTKLREIIREYPNAKIFIAGHSHGGNVALYALKDEELAEQVSGVITLSTPFITCVERSVNSAGRLMVNTITRLWFIALLAFISHAVTKTDISLSDGYALFNGMGVTGAVFAVLSVALWVMRGVLLNGQRRQAKVDHLLENLSLPEIGPEKLFCAASAWDEAFYWLSTWHRNSALPHRFWNLPAIYFASCCLSAWFVFYQLPVLVEQQWGLWDYVWGLMSIAPKVISIPIGGLLLMGTLSLLLFVITVTVPLLLRAHFLGFGGESWSCNLLVDIGIRQTPRDTISANIYKPTGTGLVHSRLYVYKKCIVDIADWMNQKLASAPPAKQPDLFAPLTPLRQEESTPQPPTTAVTGKIDVQGEIQ